MVLTKRQERMLKRIQNKKETKQNNYLSFIKKKVEKRYINHKNKMLNVFNTISLNQKVGYQELDIIRDCKQLFIPLLTVGHKKNISIAGSKLYVFDTKELKTKIDQTKNKIDKKIKKNPKDLKLNVLGKVFTYFKDNYANKDEARYFFLPEKIHPAQEEKLYEILFKYFDIKKS